MDSPLGDDCVALLDDGSLICEAVAVAVAAHSKLCMRNLTGVCELRMTSTARSCDACVRSISLTANIRSPVLSVPFKPAGLFSSTCFMKMPVMNALFVPSE